MVVRFGPCCRELMADLCLVGESMGIKYWNVTLRHKLGKCSHSSLCFWTDFICFSAMQASLRGFLKKTRASSHAINWTKGKGETPRGWLSTGTGCPEGWGSVYLLRYLEFRGTMPWGLWSTMSQMIFLDRRVEWDHLHSNLNYSDPQDKILTLPSEPSGHRIRWLSHPAGQPI